nr:RecName: Full=Pollen allergen Ory s 2-A; AltName: Allergen=Ory s 2-A [Oryza sativa Japonica Group]
TEVTFKVGEGSSGKS